MGGGVYPNKRWAIAKVNHVWKREECSAERTRWEGERVDRLRTERRPGVWPNGGLKSEGVGGISVS